MKMIEMSVRQENQINGGQVFDSQAGALDAFEQEQPVGEIRVDENVQIGELRQERSMADPGERNLALAQFGKLWLFMLTGARGQKSLPNHLMKKSARVEMFARRQVFERAGQSAALLGRRAVCVCFGIHATVLNAS